MIDNKLVLGIVGTRDRHSIEDFIRTEKLFLKFFERKPELIICSGLAVTGGDQFAFSFHLKYNCNILLLPFRYDLHGKAGGFIRNNYIARISDALIAVVSVDRTGGTEDTIQKFRKYHPNGKLYINYPKLAIKIPFKYCNEAICL